MNVVIQFIVGFVLMLGVGIVQAACEGCLCPGDPCKLCPLPAVKDVPIKADEAELCARIREKVPPTAAKPGQNEYFPSLDRSISVCVSEGGDLIKNRRRNEEYPSRFYCKPPAAPERE